MLLELLVLLKLILITFIVLQLEYNHDIVVWTPLNLEGSRVRVDKAFETSVQS